MTKSLLEIVRFPYHFFWATFSAAIYRFPSRQLTVIGITGTKGKTTVTELLAKILETAGHKVAVANGLHFKIGGKEEPGNPKMTMPGRGKLQKFLRDAVNADCKYAIIEVTSEGIKQHRHRFIKFDVAAITNLQKEHIEAHGSFEAYRAAKGELFKITQNIHVLNSDDASFEYYNSFTAKQKFYYSVDKLEKYDLTPRGTTFSLDGRTFTTSMLGVFNLYNALCSIAIARALNVTWEPIWQALANFTGAPGRMEFIQKEPFSVIVDYAHTPDSLEAVYKTARDALSPKHLICVLGAAGGGRDKWKRPEMGKVAAKYCNNIILTNEDPYDEDPHQILSEIEFGISKSQFLISKYEKILDRREAIKKAVSLAEKGDAVIITGKGAEKWIAVAGGKKIPWSDVETAKEILGKV